jgi:hypothetical protein
MNVPENPYEVSQSIVESVAATSVSLPERRLGQRCWRFALILLLLPAAYNLWCYHLEVFGTSRPSVMTTIFRATNWAWLSSGGLAVWFAGLAVLEFLTRVIHSLKSRRASLSDWNFALYKTLNSAPLFAIFGAVLWVVWVTAYYHWRLNFYAISIPVGVAAHSLAAGLYLPLFWRWYRLG